MIVEFCEAVYEDNPKEFAEAALQIRGGRGVYFSERAYSLTDGRAIADSGVFVEVNLAADNAKALCDAISRVFGYGNSLEIGVIR